MAAEQQHKKWGAPDFERYHSGKMTEAEMHALEKAALDDPFLEDALEGYAYTKTPVADITAIKEKLWPQEEDVKTPVVWFRQKAFRQLMKAAAILIIFGGLGWLLWNNTGDKKEVTDNMIVATNDQPASTAKSVDSSLYNLNDSAPVIAKLDDPKVKQVITEQQINASDVPTASSAFKDYKNIPFERDEMYRNDSRAAEKASIKPSAPVGNLGLEGKVPGIAVQQANKDRSVADSITYQNFYKNNNLLANNQVRGRVVDNQGKPVAFATVRNNADRRQAVMADADGNFVMNDNSGNNAVKLEASAAGYDQANTVLNNNTANNTIVLNQSQNNLSEAVVTNGYAKRKTADSNADYYDDSKSKKVRYQWNGRNSFIQLRNAKPLEGWDYFYYVLNDNISGNKNLMQHKGRMILTFNTNDTGKVIHVAVKKSLNAQADSIASSILYKSPVLQITDKQKPAEAVIRIN